MLLSDVTLLVFQSPISWLKEEALEKVASSDPTLLVSQSPTSWLKEEALEKVASSDLTLLVSQAPTSWLNSVAYLNKFRSDVTLEVSQVPILPFVASKLGQFPDAASLKQVVFALLSSFKFAGVRAKTGATHSIMMILALMIPAETLVLPVGVCAKTFCLC